MLEGPTEGVCECCKMDVKSRWTPTWHRMGFLCFMVTWTIFKYQLFGGRLNTKLGDLDNLNVCIRWFILFYHVWGPAWNSFWLRARSGMTSHYTWGSVTARHDFGGVLGWLVDIYFWVLTISWSRLLAHVWSRPKGRFTPRTMESDHGRWPFAWSDLHAPIS